MMQGPTGGSKGSKPSSGSMDTLKTFEQLLIIEDEIAEGKRKLDRMLLTIDKEKGPSLEEAEAEFNASKRRLESAHAFWTREEEHALDLKRTFQDLQLKRARLMVDL